MLGGLWSRPVQEGTAPIRRKKKQWQTWGKRIAVSLFIGCLFACSFGPGLNEGYILDDWLRNGLIFGIMFGLSSLLLQHLFIRASSANPAVYTAPHRPSQQWKRLVSLFQTIHGQRALLVATIGLAIGLLFGLLNNPSLTLSFGLINGLLYGLISVLVSLILGVQTGNIHLTERLKWTRATLLRSLLRFNHLRITFLLTASVLLISGLVFMLIGGLWFGLLYSPSYGLSIGLSYWLWFGLFQGIAPERIEDQDRRIPNQGIQRSLYNGVIMSIISGAIIGIVTMLSDWLLYWFGSWLSPGSSPSAPDFGLNYWLFCGLLAGICGGILACVVMGGLATLQHYVIRLLLWRSRTFPMLVAQFLDDATARFLLRRVGGGYQFTHRLLLDHLADAPMPCIEQPAEALMTERELSSS